MKKLFTFIVLLFVSTSALADYASFVDSAHAKSEEAQSVETNNETQSKPAYVEADYAESVSKAKSDYEQRIDYLENTDYEKLEKKATRGSAGFILASVATIAALGNSGLVVAGAAVTVGSVFYVKDTHKALSDKRTLGHEL
ncbi:hypothetical protein BCS96_11335 [Vibrio breoganii]|uniref:hypothetical protein n=1 Tax=Vibrio breoganii TaxID=553239 RepID=UPI000C866B5B|nr:hypothetical protein [Vibrio breoganii]PMG91662.1 hypothetical protein BCU81_04870 [Vibrio breoganii]PMO98745.1 hypothetical protein BCS96_11335 [Vibrio breoganii]